MQRLERAETALANVCEEMRIDWLILRPTLIYAPGLDRSLAGIVRFRQRFGFVPLVSPASGLRQPVHAADLADVCLRVLSRPDLPNRAYDLSGGEILTYRQMVERMCVDVGLSARILLMPEMLFRFAIKLASFAGYPGLNSEMARRMNEDLCFDHTDAFNDLDFRPRSFSYRQ